MLMTELGRMFVQCSTYDKIDNARAANSDNSAAANETRVRRTAREISTTLITCKVVKVTRRA